MYIYMFLWHKNRYFVKCESYFHTPETIKGLHDWTKSQNPVIVSNKSDHGLDHGPEIKRRFQTL